MKHILILMIAAVMLVVCTNGMAKAENRGKGDSVKPEPVHDLIGNEEIIQLLKRGQIPSRISTHFPFTHKSHRIVTPL